MTLIIGCITKDFGIIAGDTQLSIGDLERGTTFRRETQMKLQRPSHDLVYGIMGKWSHYIPLEGEIGKVTIVNHYDLMARGIRKSEDKKKYIFEFLKEKTDIDATVLLISKNNQDLIEIDEVSSLPDKDLSNLSLNGIEFKFNEPFSNINSNYIRNLICEFYETYEISNSLVDLLFLLNNVQLAVITKGYTIDILNEEGVAHLGATNSVGGVVNLSVLTKDKSSHNILYKPYESDQNTLLDKTTYPFSKYVNSNKVIRYIDNLSMIVRTLKDPFNNNIAGALEAFILKQIEYIVREKIIQKSVMNELIEKINDKFQLNISLFDLNEGDDEFLELVLDDYEDPIDSNYLFRFFSN